MKKRSKRYKEILKHSEKEKKVDIKKVFDLVKKTSTAKFDESIDISLKINLKQSKGGDFNLRSIIKLPKATGKKFRVAVICEQDKIEEARKSGADLVGSDDLIEKIESKKFDFNKLICTPAMMSKLGKHGKVLGPKGLMPNPKLGTVSNNIKKAVEDIKNGLVEVKNDKDGNVGSSIGRKSFNNEDLINNFNFFIDAIKKEKPDTMKGELIKSTYITSSMGISYRVAGGK
jgi:large subunit ribosomal protein L1